MRTRSRCHLPFSLLACTVLAPWTAGCSGDDSSAAASDASADAVDETSGDAETVTASSDGGASDAATTVSEGGSCAKGSNTAAVVSAANAFLGTLSGTLLSEAQIAFTQALAETWTNLPGGTRNGPQIEDLSGVQQAAALTLAQTALSTLGYEELQNIRNADSVIASTTSNNSGWGAGLMHVAILGTPSTTGAWMLQFCSHHLVYNFVYNGAETGATPVFLGTEPPNWTLLADGGTLVTGLVSGSTVTFVNGQQTSSAVDATGGTGYAALEPQRAAVDAVTTALLADNTNAATAKLSGSFSDVVYGIASSGGDYNFPFSADAGDALVYPTGTTGRGVLYSALSAAEQAEVKTAIEAWVDTQACDVRTELLAAYESDEALAQTYVGYGVPQGKSAPSFAANPNAQANALDYQGSYFRIDGPRVLIEFVVQEAVAFRSQSWVHYHSVWRDKESDYGAEFKSAIDGGTATGGGGGAGGGPGSEAGMGEPPEGGPGAMP